MKKFIPIKDVIILCVLMFALGVSISRSSTSSAQDKPKPVEVKPIPAELLNVLEKSNKDVEIALLKRDNIILQMRLLLAVPNDWTFDLEKKEFIAPKPQPKVEPKPED